MANNEKKYRGELDPVSGLYTYQAFAIKAKEFIDTHQHSSLDCLAADISNFKMINALYGMEEGDKMLGFIGQTIHEALPHSIGARLGDKFFFIMDDNDKPSDLDTFKAIEKIKNYPLETDLMVQFGMYTDFNKGLSIAQLCDRTQLAIASIKGDHSMRMAKYSDSMAQAKMRELQLESKFERALSSKQFFPVFQPKVDATSGLIVGAEALVRWADDSGQIIKPVEFIPLFEKDGHIADVDLFMFKAVCEYQHDCIVNSDNTVPISVNMSRYTLFKKNSLEKYKAIIEETGVPTYLVPIEITESATIGNLPILGIVNEFVREGFFIHLDDFGSGYSSLASLSILPISAVKLDKTLADMIEDHKGQILVTHIVNMSSELGYMIIAEGVETETQVEFLLSAGCNIIQGYYYSRPVSKTEFKEMLQQGFINPQ